MDLRQYIRGGFHAHPHHFFYPALFFIAGYVIYKDGAIPLAWGFVFLGGLVSVWMVTYSLREAWTRSREADTEYLKTYHRMSPEERVELGYAVAKDTVKIETFRRNANTGALESIAYDWLPTSAAKFRLWVEGVMEGAPLTYAKWGGTGRLFTQPEYKRLTEKLLELGYIKFSNGKTSDNGFDPTQDGLNAFQDFMNPGEVEEAEP